jgi:hypothetical protein
VSNASAADSIAMFRKVDSRDPARLEVGPESLFWVPYGSVTQLPQQRTEIDADALDGLKSALTVTGEGDRVSIDLLHPPTINVIRSRAQARQYVRDLNDCWRLDHPVSAIKPFGEVEGIIYPAQIAGHRRMLAIGQLLVEQSHDPEKTDVLTSVHYGLDFMSALDIQYRENRHQQLSPWQDARAIATRFKSGVARGEFKFFKECADKMGVSPEKVSQAWRFNQLPEFVQNMVNNHMSTRLTYGKAVALYDVAHAVAGRMTFQQQHRSDMADDKSEDLLEDIGRRSLEEMTLSLDERDSIHYMHQISLHSEAIAKKRIADARKYARDNVADLLYHSNHGPILTATEYDALNRAKDLKILAKNRTDIYHFGATVLNQLVADARTIEKMNGAADTEVEKFIHSPRARRVIAEVIDVIASVDRVIPDREFTALFKVNVKKLVAELIAIGKEDQLPDEVHHALAVYVPERPVNGEVSMFEGMAS